VNGYKGAEARENARVGNLAKHEWVLAYAIDEATTAILTSVLADIKRILEDKHACTSEEERDAAMRRPCDFKYGEVWLMVKMGYINPPRPLGKHRLQKMDAETLKAEHAHICWASALGDMNTEKIISKIGKRMGRSLTKR